jgi:hypothetical protein
MSDFYVGYASRAPRSLALFVRWTVIAGATVGIVLSIALAASQDPFAPSRFEFGHPRDYTGMLIAEPVPLLVAQNKAYVLAGLGKHGVTNAVAPFNGQHVVLHGTRAGHGHDEMIEVVPGQIRISSDRGGIPERVPLGRIVLTGEVVDSKCYFGVMNPGAGKVHRDCAVRCISGGLPPALLVRDARGMLQTVLLAGVGEVKLAEALVPFIAERVTIPGELFRIADRVILETDLTGMRRE